MLSWTKFSVLTFSLGVVHGNHGHETGRDTGFNESEEESLNHDTCVVVAKHGHNDANAPSHDQACACPSQREALGSETDDRETDDIANAVE